jgi:diguanylate cyclase (GGDEF)-like protein
MQRVQATLDVALQPITDIRTGIPNGFEALVRNTDQLGFASISDFFDFADRLGVFARVDDLLFGKAIEKFARSRTSAEPILFLNLDRRRIKSIVDTLPVLNERIRGAGLAPFDICFEITEGGESSACDDILKTVDVLRRQEFGLAIDDFGTGYSGLQALYQCQPDYVKIDRFFIQSLERDARKRLFVSRVVDLTHILGIKIVAEGVERLEELHACRDAGCDLVQGFFVAPPSCRIEDMRPVYAPISENPDRRLQMGGDMPLRNHPEITMLDAVGDSDRLYDVVELMLARPECQYLPVVDQRSVPLGIIRERDLKRLIHAPYGRDLMKNKSCALSPRDFLVPCPIADAGMSLDYLIDHFSDKIGECVIVTNATKYHGVITANSLVRLANGVRLRQARSQNPLTRLPANDAILACIARACADRRTDYTFCYFDFDHFKPFNDLYGFQTGDRAIIMFADLLRAAMSSEECYLGHIGGDDFFAAVSGPARCRIEAIMQDLRSKFASDVECFYTHEHRRQGHIETAGRDGKLDRFPLLSCSAAALHVPSGARAVEPHVVVQELARLKSVAKKLTAGIASSVLLRDDALAAGEPAAA